MTALEPAELQKRARKKASQYRRKRKDPRFARAMGRLVAAGYLRTNIDGVEAYRGSVALKDALWAGTIEPRIYELLPELPRRAACGNGAEQVTGGVVQEHRVKFAVDTQGLAWRRTSPPLHSRLER